MLRNGLIILDKPILRRLDNIREEDALLDLSDPTNPREADWPDAEFIIGNPPFLGNRLLRRAFGNEYTEALFRVFRTRLPNSSDLVAYWHEKARAMIAAGRARRAGLLATQSIRGQANRAVLERIKQSGEIFMAWSDEPWVLAGANVHLSFIAQDDGNEATKTLNGQLVASINSNLTAGFDLTKARRLPENAGIAFYADVKGGPFDIDAEHALELLARPNPDGRSNRDVVKPWLNALDVTRRPRQRSIIDFGVDMTRDQAALYEAPFQHVVRHVKPRRNLVRRSAYRDRWWLHMEPIPGMRRALAGLDRFIVTPTLAKHRLFYWVPAGVLADHQLVVIARDDDYMFGVLHSRVHESWALAMGTQLETRPRYTPTTTFETFPFAHPTIDQRAEIAAAARELDRLRKGWLNPHGFSAEELEPRTLTNLYNERPAWLDDAHRRVDAAVLRAYGWQSDLDSNSILRLLLDLNQERTRSSA